MLDVPCSAREALAKFNDALPAKIDKFEDAQVAKATHPLLDAFAKDHPEQGCPSRWR